MPLPLDITDLLHGKTVEWEGLERRDPVPFWRAVPTKLS
jgi:hypothetical protein